MAPGFKNEYSAVNPQMTPDVDFYGHHVSGCEFTLPNTVHSFKLNNQPKEEKSREEEDRPKQMEGVQKSLNHSSAIH